jgi:predicted MFS family arabinose efflux permease
MFFWSGPILNKQVSILLLISGLATIAFAMFSPIYALFVKDIGGGITDASTAWAVFWLVAGILTLPAGRLINRMKEKELGIAWAQLFACIAYCLLYFTDTLTMLHISMVVIGISNAFFWPAFHSVFDKHADGKHMTMRWSLYDSLTYMIPAVGSFVGGIIVKFYGFDLLFLIMAGVSFLCGLMIVLLPRRVL